MRIRDHRSGISIPDPQHIGYIHMFYDKKFVNGIFSLYRRLLYYKSAQMTLHKSEPFNCSSKLSFCTKCHMMFSFELGLLASWLNKVTK